jgi:hypothetical protein
MSAAIKRFFASFILIVFCFYITPKDVLHLFTHHDDTEHLILNSNEQHFEKEHHHCNLLKVDQRYSAPTFEIPFLNFIQKHYFLLNQKFGYYSFVNNENVNLSFSLRGPPFFV